MEKKSYISVVANIFVPGRRFKVAVDGHTVALVCIDNPSIFKEVSVADLATLIIMKSKRRANTGLLQDYLKAHRGDRSIKVENLIFEVSHLHTGRVTRYVGGVRHSFNEESVPVFKIANK